MTLIKVNPSLLESSGQCLQSEGQTISSIGGNLLGAVQSAPSYDGQFGPQVSAIGQEAYSRLGNSSSHLSNLGTRLSKKGVEFQMVDDLGLSAVNGTEYRRFIDLSIISSLSQNFIDRLYSLGNLISPAELATRLGQLKSVLLMGRTGARKMFGLVPSFIADLRFNPFRNIKGVTPLGLSLDFGLGLIAGKVNSFMDGVVVAADTAINAGIGIIAWEVPVLNAIIQLGGSAVIWGNTQNAKLMAVNSEDLKMLDESSGEAQTALKKLDIGILTHDTATLVVDFQVQKFEAVNRAYQEMIRNPNTQSISRFGVFAYSSTMPGMHNVFLADAKVSQSVLNNYATLGKDVLNFGDGLIEAPIALIKHDIVSKAIYTKGLINRVHSASENIINLINESNH